MRLFVRLSSIAALAVALAAVPGSAQKTTGPKAQYDMDVETVSGIAAMKVDVGSMLLGGGGLKMDGTAYRLDLRLGSSTAPAKAPAKADHFLKSAAGPFRLAAALKKPSLRICPPLLYTSPASSFTTPQG